jgi:hypothetical protein
MKCRIPEGIALSRLPILNIPKPCGRKRLPEAQVPPYYSDTQHHFYDHQSFRAND